MRLIRKLALQKQKHTKKKKNLFPASEGACGSFARSRGSVFRTHNSGQERAQLLLSGPTAGRPGAGGERLGEYSCRLSPLLRSVRLGCSGPLGTSVILALCWGFFPLCFTSNSPIKGGCFFAGPGHACDGGGGVGWAARGHSSNLWLPGLQRTWEL